MVESFRPTKDTFEILYNKEFLAKYGGKTGVINEGLRLLNNSQASIVQKPQEKPQISASKAKNVRVVA